jgi:hypothetical protein
MNTVAELEYLRDLGLLPLLQRPPLGAGVGVQRAQRGEPPPGQGLLFSMANSRKVRKGSWPACRPRVRRFQLAQEKKLKEYAGKEEKFKDALKARGRSPPSGCGPEHKRHSVLEQGGGFNSELFDRPHAGAGRRRKANPTPSACAIRRRQPRGAEVQLFSPEEIYPEWEIAKLADG